MTRHPLRSSVQWPKTAGRRGRGIVRPRRLATTLLLALGLAGAARSETVEAVSPPPGPRPIRVEIGFYLLNLVSVDERSETFDADLYLSVRWKDPRLAFTTPARGHDVQIYQGDTAAARLEEIWWPNLEFVNTSTPEVTNRTLFVHADGTVDYQMGLSSTFRANLDMRHFPFDRQSLDIRIQSFESDRSELVFEPDLARMGFSADEHYAGLTVEGIEAETRSSAIAGWSEDFSELLIHVNVMRSPRFYVWTVFFPVSLVLLLSCTIFFVDIKGFHNRVSIALACFLACIATQFAMSFNLPKISYLTPIDRLFLVAYACMALGVGVSVVETSLMHSNPERLRRTDRLASWSIPLLYAMLVFFVVLP